MQISGAILPGQLLANPGDASKPKDIASAAQQFEALMLGQLLQAAAGESNGWFGTGEADQAGMQAMSLAQEQFASALASGGGLGLASMITSQLAPVTKESDQ